MTVKIAVSLPDELVADARRAVESGRAASVSAYVAAAMRSFGHQESLGALLDDLDGELGSPSARDAAWARSMLGGREQ